MEIGLKPSLFSPSLFRKAGIAVFFSILLFGAPLRADDTASATAAAKANHNEVYAGFAYGKTKMTSHHKITQGPKLDNEDNGHMFFIGRELGDGWSAEGFYADLGEVKWSGKTGDKYSIGSVNYNVLLDTNITTTGQSYGIAGKYSWDVGRNTRLYAKLGMHSWEIKSRMTYSGGSRSRTTDGTDAMGGLGLEYAVSDQISIIAGSDNYVFGDDDVSLSYVGLRFGFN